MDCKIKNRGDYMNIFKKSPTKELKELLQLMYSVNDVENGYNYWFNKLLQRCMSIFNWNGLPDSIPEREIELNLLLTGHCVIFEKNGKLITQVTTLYGNEDSIYYYPTKAIYASPKAGSGTLEINKNCSIIYNSPLQNNIFYLPTECGGQWTYPCPALWCYGQGYATQVCILCTCLQVQ